MEVLRNGRVEIVRITQLTSAVLVLAALGSAQAQGIASYYATSDGGSQSESIDLPSRTRPATAGSAEQRYGAALGRELGLPASVQQSQRRYTSESLASPYVSGLNRIETDITDRIDDRRSEPAPERQSRTSHSATVEMPGLSVERARFETKEDALNYALHVADLTQHPSLIEVRGNQVLMVQGDRLRDPAATAQVRQAAWNHLPAPAGEPQVMGVFLGDQEFVLTSQSDDHELGEQLRAAMDAARQRTDRDGIQVQDDQARVELDNGFRARVDHSADGHGASWITYDPTRTEALDAYLDRLLADNEALNSAEAARDQQSPGVVGQEPVQGAADQLNSMFSQR
jgi:hypothetical protein